MESLQSLQSKLNNLKTKKIQLSTRLEELVRQESEQRAKLSTMGIVDVDKSLSSLSAEASTLQASIETAFRGFSL